MTRSAPAKTNSENALMRYFRDTRAEIAKVSWPTREEGIRLTLIVLTVTVVSGIFLWLIDVSFSFIIAWILQAMG